VLTISESALIQNWRFWRDQRFIALHPANRDRLGENATEPKVALLLAISLVVVLNLIAQTIEQS
jgi:hypothetical protein